MGEQEKQPEDMALWRFGIISPLLHRQPDGLPLGVEIQNLADQTFFTPQGKEKRLSPETIRSWLYRYRSLGLNGLCNKVRRDKHRTSLPEALQKSIVRLREKFPALTTHKVMQKLLEGGQWNGRSPSRSAIYRFVTFHDLRRKIDSALPAVGRSFQYEHFGDLWQGDYMHGPKVREGTYLKKAYLCLILDDATRYIVAASFHLAENTRALLSNLMLAVRRFGIARRFYTDNGPAFRSKHLRMVAGRLGISLPHTPPYKPQGRGKNERIFRTIRGDFLAGRPTTTLARLNADFQKWMALYHQRLHSSLGMSPLNRKDTDTGPALAQLPAVSDADALFRMEDMKKVQNDGCVRINGNRYEVKDALPGQQIKVAYLPWKMNAVWVGDDMTEARPVDLIKNATRFNKPNRTKRG
jgi:transposase InsO family protein